MRRLRALIWLLFLGFGLLLFRETLLGGQVFAGGEITAHQMPLQKAAADAVHAGRLPVWAPELACGLPLLAEGEAAVLYPARALEYFAGVPYYRAYSWTVFLQCVLAALGMALLARKLGLGYLAATFAGLAFGFSGYLVSHVPDLPLLQSAAWLPWLLACLIAGVESGAWAWFVGAAAAFALSLYGGGFQVCVVEVGVALLALLWLLLAPGQPPWAHKFTRVILGGVGALALGVGLAAAQLLPTLDLAESSGWRLGSAVLPHLHASDLLTLLRFYLDPHFFREGNLSLSGGDCGYVGGVTVLLALVALFIPRLPLRHRWLWVALGALGLAWALGRAQPAYGVLGSSPLYPAPGLGLLLAALSLPLLAAGLVEALARSDRRKPVAQVLAICGGLALAAQWGALLYARHLPGPDWFMYPRWDPSWQAFAVGLGVAAVAGLLLWLTRLPYAAAASLLIVALGLQLYILHSNGTALASRYTEPLSGLPRPDPGWSREYTEPGLSPKWDPLPGASAALGGMPSANAPYYFLPSRQADLLSVRIPAGLEGKPAGVQAPVQALRMLGVRRLVAEGGMRDPWLQGPAQENWRVTVYRLAAPMPRAWLPRKLALCAEGQQALGGVADAGFLPEETAYVEGLPLAQARELRDGRGLVRLTQDRGSGLTFEVQTPAPNFLVVNQAYNPHWRATVGDQAANLYRADYVLCGVLVPAGKSTVRLEYVPDDLYLGAQIAATAAALALLWLLLAGAGGVVARRRGRRRR